MWCATPVTQSVAEAVSRRTGVSWVTAYGTSELPVIACNEIEGARLDTVGRPVPGTRVRIVSLEDGAPLSPGAVRRDSGSLGFGDGRLPAERGDGAGIFGRVVSDGRRRISGRQRRAADHRPRQGDDQGAGISGRPRRDRGRAPGSRGRRGLRGVRGARRGRMGRPSSPRSRRADGSRPTSSSRLSGTGWRPTSGPSRVVFVPEIPRLPSGKVLRRVLKERLWTSV